MPTTPIGDIALSKPTRLSLLVCAWLTLALLLAQFLMAGLALFHNGSIWACHTTAGFVLAAPLAVMLTVSFARHMGSLRWWSLALSLAYIAQILLIVATQRAGWVIGQALHPFNGALLLTCAMVVLAKIRTATSSPDKNGVR